MKGPSGPKGNIMVPYQQRVVEERDELEARLIALDVFLESGKGNSLEPKQLALLHIQAAHMRGYLAILNERVRGF